MNGTGESLTELRAITAGLSSDLGRKLDAVICVPATLLSRAAETLEGGTVALGGQDCHPKVSGAHTGDVSAEMLKEAGASHVILGHSERRTDHREGNDLVRSKPKLHGPQVLSRLFALAKRLTSARQIAHLM